MLNEFKQQISQIVVSSSTDKAFARKVLISLEESLQQKKVTALDLLSLFKVEYNGREHFKNFGHKVAQFGDNTSTQIYLSLLSQLLSDETVFAHISCFKSTAGLSGR